ncbi:MAG: hypothetical protein AB7K52_10905 [Phycisphaerales bacterium]
MAALRRPRLPLVLFASAWALVLAVAGVRALVLATESRSVGDLVFPSWAWLCAGWTSLAGAQLVFSSLVADRLYPHAHPAVTGAVELAAMIVMVVGGVVLLTGALA